ncbi:E3 ubiquitin-protein ligase RNFT1-like [Maniola hyperantus]|uniref:E3 ubiquitin-protein ligase RNFT1-like n=1 Tax=Aphantopus hyperantus TaxID=2795564 RepID=UPI0037497CDC
MITYVAKAVNLLASLLQIFVGITSSIGKVIVVVMVATISFIISSLLNVITFFQIVYEDNVSIFTEDLPNISIKFIEAICQQWYNLHDILTSVCNETIFKFNLIFSNIKWSFDTVFVIFGEVLFMLKKTVIFLGNTLWLVLTFVPVHLPYLVKAYVKYMRDIVITYTIDAYMVLLKVTNFLSDVPLESFIGIISAILIVRSCIHFREVITSQITDFYWTLVRKFMYLYYALYNYFINPEVRIIAQIVGEQQVTFRNVDTHMVTENDNDDSVDALCVICQERQKCVLTLPCRHVCLCTECCVRLYGYQRTCPICRTFIYHSVTIYL